MRPASLRILAGLRSSSTFFNKLPRTRPKGFVAGASKDCREFQREQYLRKFSRDITAHVSCEVRSVELVFCRSEGFPTRNHTASSAMPLCGRGLLSTRSTPGKVDSEALERICAMQLADVSGSISSRAWMHIVNDVWDDHVEEGISLAPQRVSSKNFCAVTLAHKPQEEWRICRQKDERVGTLSEVRIDVEHVSLWWHDLSTNFCLFIGASHVDTDNVCTRRKVTGPKLIDCLHNVRSWANVL
eukprot:scaffold98974_cov32-Tisochrysis_lutea.AAC.2